MTFKQKIYSGCKQILQQRTDGLNAALSSLSEALNNETKSSAGDKHETSRAMLQLEQEKISKQLKEADAQLAELEKLNPDLSLAKVTKGALIKTNQGYLFLGPAIGKIRIDEEFVVVLSPLSPLGKKLVGLKENDSVEMNGTKYLIQEFY